MTKELFEFSEAQCKKYIKDIKSGKLGDIWRGETMEDALSSVLSFYRVQKEHVERYEKFFNHIPETNAINLIKEVFRQYK